MNFKAARAHIERLKGTYRALAHSGELTDESAFWIMAQIEEIEREIAEAKRKMTAVQGSHNVVNIANYSLQA